MGAGIELLSGVFVPVTSPFDRNTGALDVEALQSNVQHLFQHPLRGVVTSGTTGEAVLLTRSERSSAILAAREVLPRDRVLIAGTGAESTDETLRNGEDAARAGADALLVQPPAFYRRAMDDRHLAEHYRTVADESSIPVVLYQVPLSCSTLELSTALVSELSAHSNIVGIKDSRGDLGALADHVSATESGFAVFVGNGAKLFDALELGAAGGIVGVANLAPGEAAEIYRSYDAGASAEAARIQSRVAPLHNQIVAAEGVPGVKAALDLLGATGGPPRSPLRAADDETIQRVRNVLHEAGFLDIPVAAE